MSQETVSEFILALKTLFDVTSDDSLAEHLGIGKSTIASWRRRGSVPKKTSDEITRKFGIDWDNINNPREHDAKLIKILQRAAFNLAIMRLAKSLDEKDLIDAASWIAADPHIIYLALGEHFERDDIVRAQPADFTVMIMRVARGEIATPEQIMRWRQDILEMREPYKPDVPGPKFPT